MKLRDLRKMLSKLDGDADVYIDGRPFARIELTISIVDDCTTVDLVKDES